MYYFKGNWANSILHHGLAPTTRELMRELEYKSTYSVMLLLNKLIDLGYLSKKDGKLKLLKDLELNDNNARTVNIPLVGSAPCGAPLFAEQNIEAIVPVSISLAKPGNKYFLLRTTGDSMNLKGIEEGNLVLVRQQDTADNGDVVVALIDDQATIKEFERGIDVVILKPRSSNSIHQPIILTEDFRIQGKVIATLPKF